MKIKVKKLRDNTEMSSYGAYFLINLDFNHIYGK